MGNNSPAPISPEITSRFELIRRLEGQSLFLLEEISTHRQYLMRELRYRNTNEFLQAVDLLQSKKNSAGSHYLTPLKEYITRAEDDYCVSQHKIFALFEYPHHNLEQQILERSCQRRRFSEKQVWAILASCIHGLAHLQKTGLTHECLRSDQVLLESDGSIKVADPFCCSVGLNYELIYENLNTRHIYPSPELCQSIQEGHTMPPNSINQFRSDVFTVGIMMLQVCLLQSQDDCYLMNKRNVNWQKVQMNLQKLSEKYSPELRQIVELMVRRQYRERPDWIEMEFNLNRNRGNVYVEESKIRQITPAEQINVQTVTVTQQRPGAVIRQQSPKGVPIENHQRGIPMETYQGGNVPPQHQQHIIKVLQSRPQHQVVNHSSQNVNQVVTSQTTTNVQRPPDSLVHTTYSVPTGNVDANLIVPVQPSNYLVSRPNINFKMGRPAENYITRTRVDENLVEVLDDSQRDSHFATKLNRSAVKFSPAYMETFPAIDSSKVMFSGNNYMAGLPKANTNNNLYTPSNLLTGTSSNNFTQGLNITNNHSITASNSSSYMAGGNNNQKNGITQLTSFANAGAANTTLPGGRTAITTTYSSNNIGNMGNTGFTFTPSSTSNDLGTPAFRTNSNTQDVGLSSAGVTKFTPVNFTSGSGTLNYSSNIGAAGKIMGGLQSSSGMGIGMGMSSTGHSTFGLTGLSSSSSNYDVTTSNKYNLGIGAGSISNDTLGNGTINNGLGNKGLSSFNVGSGKFDTTALPSINSSTTGLSGMGTFTNSFGMTDPGKFNFGNNLNSFNNIYTDIKTTTLNTTTNTSGNQFVSPIGSNRTPVHMTYNNDIGSRPRSQDKQTENLFTDMSIFNSKNAVRSQSQDKYTDPFKFGGQFTTKGQIIKPEQITSPKDMLKKTYMSPSAVTTNIALEKHPASPVLEMLKGFDQSKQSPNRQQNDPISQPNLPINIGSPPPQASTFSFNNMNSQSVPIENKQEPSKFEAPQSFNVNSLLQGINFPPLTKVDDTMFTDYSKFGITRGGGGGGGLNSQSKNGPVAFSLEKKPTLVASLGTPADALNLLNSAQFSSKNSLGKAESINLEDASSHVESTYPANPVVMSFDTNSRQPNRLVAENVGSSKPLDAITQSSTNEQSNKEQLPQSQATFQAVPIPKDEKINIVDHDDIMRVQALKFPQAQPTLVESQEIKNFDNVLSQKPDGPTFVIETFKQGSRYEGQKLNQMRHGKGKFFYQDGGLYDGDWKQNRMDGIGKLYYQSGKLAYDGEWKNDQFCGHGILYNEYPHEFNDSLDFENFEEIEEYWTKFEGQFKDDLKEGRGILHFINGEYFEGIFNKDAISGPGEFHSRNGDVTKGVWDNNRLVRLEN